MATRELICKPQDWIIFRRRYVPTLWPIIAYQSWSKKKELGSRGNVALSIWRDGWFTVSWPHTLNAAVIEKVFERLQARKKDLAGLRDEGLAAGAEVYAYTKAFADHVTTADLQSFVSFFEHFTHLYEEFFKKNMLFWAYGSQAVEQHANQLLNKYTEQERKHILDVMIAPTTHSYSQYEERDFARLVALAKKEGLASDKVVAALQRFSDKYFWFSYEYIGPEIWNVEAVAKRVEEALAAQPHKDTEKNVAHQQKACIQKYNLSHEVQELFALLQITTLMQDDRKMLNAKTCYYLDYVIMTELAKRLALSLEAVRYIDVALLRDYILSQNKIALQAELEARQHFFILYQTDDETRIESGEKGMQSLQKLGIDINKIQEQLTECRGQPANHGIAQGRARVLATSSNAGMEPGDIIVTGMTTPDFVPLLRKAAAIVTDEGGITSHAAIISRELGIPCVIATKIATRIIKTGDLIEVDANTGIVRKL